VVGKALTLWESAQPKVTFLGTGSMSSSALSAARALDADGIGSIVLHVPTVKPLDEAAVLAAAKRTGKVITVEEHQIAGGFGSAVAEFLSQTYPVPITRLGIDDQFGQSGNPEELLEHYGLGAPRIADTARKLVERRII
jgi:transketolase